MDVECCWPGSIQDPKVFANSSVNNKLRKRELLAVFQSVLPGFDKVPTYLIGNLAYPLTPFCVKEYDSCAINERVVFNDL